MELRPSIVGWGGSRPERPFGDLPVGKPQLACLSIKASRGGTGNCGSSIFLTPHASSDPECKTNGSTARVRSEDKKPLMEEIIDACISVHRQKLLEELCKCGVWQCPLPSYSSSPTHSVGMDSPSVVKSGAHLSKLGNSTSSVNRLLDENVVVTAFSPMVYSMETSTDHASEEPPKGSNRESATEKTSRASFAEEKAVLWPIWRSPEAPSRTYARASTSASRHSRFSDSDVIRTGDTMRTKGCWQSWIVRPSSTGRILWDVMSIFIMAYDVVLIPMMVFDLPNDTFLKIMALCVACFWSVDLLFSFFTGFHAAGIVEMRPRQVALRYIKTWFLLDLIVVSCDWFAIRQIMASNNADAVRTSKTLKVIRVLRVVRFLRIWKVVYLVSEYGGVVNSENVIQFLGIVKFIIVILMINHYIACGWYACAEYYPDGIGNTWIGALDESRGLLYRYTTALHWSFTQFTPASMEVHPHNSLERVISVIVLLSGLVVFSSFVSGITSAMTRVRENNKERNRQRDNLRRYITDNKVSLELGRRIKSFLKAQGFVHRNRVMQEDVTVFKLLPAHILMDLHAEVFLPIATRHPLFHQFVNADEAGLVEICDVAMSEVAAEKGENLFYLHQKATRMSFIVEGSFNYYLGDHGNALAVDEDDFISEAVLWLRWFHRGRLEATKYCALVGLRANDFHNAMSKTSSWKSCQGYAYRVGNHLYPAEPDFETRLTKELSSQSCLQASGQGVAVMQPADSSPGSVGLSPGSTRKSLTALTTITDLWQEFDLIQEMAQQAFEVQMEEYDQFCKMQSVGSAFQLGTRLHRMLHFIREKTRTADSSNWNSSERERSVRKSQS